MRKFFALALAVAMVLSLASVSFAVTDDFNMDSDIVLSKFYKYSSDDDKLQDAQAQYGKSYYAVIYEGAWELVEAGLPNNTSDDTAKLTYAPITSYKAVEKMKVKAEFEMGEDLVESVSIVKKSFDKDATDVFAIAPTEAVKNNTAAANDTLGAGTPVAAAKVDGYVYCVEIKTKADRVTGEADIVGTLEFNRKAKNGFNKVDDDEVDFALNLLYENAYIDATGDKTDYTIDGDGVELKWDDLYLLKFDCDDEIEIEFGTEPNEGVFTVDVSGQGKMVVDFNTKANEAIYAANEGVKMHFINFNGAKFNRTGVFEYELENMVAAYQIVDDKLVEINGLEIDGEIATFSTRTLGNYVFADAELVNPVAEAPVVEAPAAVTNPSTGF